MITFPQWFASLFFTSAHQNNYIYVSTSEFSIFTTRRMQFVVPWLESDLLRRGLTTGNQVIGIGPTRPPLSSISHGVGLGPILPFFFIDRTSHATETIPQKKKKNHTTRYATEINHKRQKKANEPCHGNQPKTGEPTIIEPTQKGGPIWERRLRTHFLDSQGPVVVRGCVHLKCKAKVTRDGPAL